MDPRCWVSLSISVWAYIFTNYNNPNVTQNILANIILVLRSTTFSIYSRHRAVLSLLSCLFLPCPDDIVILLSRILAVLSHILCLNPILHTFGFTFIRFKLKMNKVFFLFHIPAKINISVQYILSFLKLFFQKTYTCILSTNYYIHCTENKRSPFAYFFQNIKWYYSIKVFLAFVCNLQK